jgi:uncharacterized protein (TIGR02597 family)
MAGNAQTVTSDIVGYNTITASANGGSGTKYSLLAVNLLNAPSFVGTLNGSLTAAAGSFTAGQFNQGTYPKYYAEITSGSNAGSQADIVSNTTDTLIVVGNASFQTAVGTGATVTIRKHRTLSDVFGGSTGSATATDVLIAKGATLGAADNVIIKEAGVDRTFYYSSSTLKPGWRDSGSVLSTDRPIYPNQGLMIARKSNSNATITVVGSVKTGVSFIDLPAGYNLVSLPAPSDMTLVSLFGGSTGAAAATDVKIAKGATLGAADNILVAKTDGTYDTYYYSSSTLKPGWRNSASTASSTVTISGNASVFIKKQLNGNLSVTQITQ